MSNKKINLSNDPKNSQRRRQLDLSLLPQSSERKVPSQKPLNFPT